MSDTVPRTSSSGAQWMADALLRTLGGTSAQLRISATQTGGTMSELGLVANTYAEVVLSPVAMRKLRPAWQKDDAPQWELLVSASSVQQQVSALDLDSAESLFSMVLRANIAGQDYLIQSVTSNEAFGQVYLFRLLLREARPQAI